ncbi:MAG: type I secretion system permease/ATPase [Alphaproteobacteria bacterium]|nr:type I secretion system permease/ATPase [Alphaproteobacteria bacterium]
MTESEKISLKNNSKDIINRVEDDDLIQCLIFITRFWGIPQTAAVITAGLPLSDQGMTLELLEQAAEKISFSVKISSKDLIDINQIHLPCVLLLENKKAVILVKIKNDQAQIVEPSTLDVYQHINLDDLKKLYIGSLVLIRPKIHLDPRALEFSTTDHQKNWFWGRLIKFLPVYIQVFIASIFLNIFGLASPIFSMAVYDRIVPNSAFESLWVLALGVIMAFGFDFLMRLLRGYFIDQAGRTLDQQISNHIFEHILSMRMDKRPQSSGGLANIIREFENIRDFLTSASLSTLVDIPFLLLFIAILYMVGGSIAFIPLVIIPLVLICSLFLQIPMRRSVDQAYKETAQKQALLVETIQGLESIKVSRAEGYIQRRWRDFVTVAAQSATTSKFWSLLTINFATFMSNITVIFVMIWGVYHVADGRMTVGALIASSMLTSRAMAPLAQIAGIILRLYQSWASLKGLNQLMKIPVERPFDKIFLNQTHIKESIEFRDVVFSYPQQYGKVLNGINFKIKAGEKIGILGRIGSGKTTIGRLLLNLYEPENGMITLDGIDIRQIDPVDLRSRIGTVLQDSTIFYGSIKDNITMGQPYIQEETILEAAKISGVYNFIKDHPHGFNFQVGEDGKNLSGGQRQAIILARAILLNPPIFLFDEPTSAMDNSTENSFKDRFAQILPNKTFILITHRQAMLSLVDRLIVLDNGKIVADGPKKSVIDSLTKGQIHAAASSHNS